MEQSDLMIGDWVIYDPNVFNEDEYEPTKECFTTKINSGEDIDLAIEGCYMPLPLTPEILEKNGFESIITVFNGLTYQYASKNEECRVRVFVNDKNIATSIEIDSKVCWLNYDCSFVHELQHALKLCCVKKEIVL